MLFKKLSKIFKKKRKLSAKGIKRQPRSAKKKKPTKKVPTFRRKTRKKLVSLRKTPSQKSARPVKTKPALKQVAGIAETRVGVVIHYFTNISVAIVKLNTQLRVGERVHFKGFTTDFKQTVSSLQINHKQIESAQKNQEVGIKVADRTRIGDTMFRVEKG